MKRALLFIWAVMPSLVLATNYFDTDSHDWLPQMNACQAQSLESNNYYCHVFFYTSLNTGASPGNTMIGTVMLKTKTGSIVNHYLFGFAGTTKPQSFTCMLPNSYDSNTGLCSSANNAAVTEDQYWCSDTGGGVDENPGGGLAGDYVAGQGCQWDNDSDGIFSYLDNCPINFNPAQEDNDNDGLGDVCDGCVADQYTMSYSGPGFSIKASLPNSICDGNKCILNLNLSVCSQGVCNINYSANGAQCEVPTVIDLASYVAPEPSSLGFDLAADNASFVLNNGLVSLLGANAGQKFVVTNCLYSKGSYAYPGSPDEFGVPAIGFDWADPYYTSQGCESVDFLNTCLTAGEIDSNIQSYARSNNKMYTPFQWAESVPAARGYVYYHTGHLVRGSYSSQGKTFDSQLGNDTGNGDYTVTLQSGFRVKLYNPEAYDGQYLTTSTVSDSTGQYFPYTFQLHGCTGGDVVGGGGGGGVSGSVSVTELAENQTDISDSLSSMFTDRNAWLDQTKTKIENIDQDYMQLVNGQGQSCVDENGLPIPNCEVTDQFAPSFLSQAKDFFGLNLNNQSACPTLTVNKYGFTGDLLADFCSKWEQYGKPVWSIIFYFLTIVGIYDLWFAAAPKSGR